MEKYIISTRYNYYFSDTLDDSYTRDVALYYVELVNVDQKSLGILKRTSLGSDAEQRHMRILFNMNEVKPYIRR